MAGLLFVTAPEANHKALNRILLHLRDWEHDSGDRFKLVTTRNAYDLEPPTSSTQGCELDSTVPPVPANIENSWAGATLEDIEAFTINLDDTDPRVVNSNLYVLVDTDGLQNKTCIFGERLLHWDSDTSTCERDPEKFRKMRMPWEEVYSVWCNLDIANMDFEEWAEEEGGDSWEWYTFCGLGEPHLGKENRRARDAEIERFKAEERA